MFGELPPACWIRFGLHWLLPYVCKLHLLSSTKRHAHGIRVPKICVLISYIHRGFCGCSILSRFINLLSVVIYHVISPNYQPKHSPNFWCRKTCRDLGDGRGHRTVSSRRKGLGADVGALSRLSRLSRLDAEQLWIVKKMGFNQLTLPIAIQNDTFRNWVWWFTQ